MRRLIKDLLLFPLGAILYLVHPGFRAMVKAKLKSGNDQLRTGEVVIAVIDNGESKKAIGGSK